MTSGSYYRSLHNSIPVMTQDMANQKANFGVDMSNNIYDIVEDVCEGYYTDTYKMTFKECRDIRDAKIVRSGGHIPSAEVQNDVEDAMNVYRQDGGKAEAEKIIKETIEKKIKNLMEKMRQLQRSLE